MIAELMRAMREYERHTGEQLHVIRLTGEQFELLKKEAESQCERECSNGKVEINGVPVEVV